MNLGVSKNIYVKVPCSQRGQLKKACKDKVSVATQVKVVDMWLENSRELPLKKRVKKGCSMFLLEDTYASVYLQFRKTYPTIKLGFKKFSSNTIKCS